MLHRIVILLICVLACAPPRARAEVDAYAGARAEFKTAWSEINAATFPPAAADSEALRSYPLYPYLQAARFEKQLSAVPPPKPGAPAAGLLPLDETIDTFLASVADQPVARSLRPDWLKSLANRRAWSKYLEEYVAERDGDDANLRCAAFAGRIALGRTNDMASAVAETWLTAKALPDACDAAFDWLRARGGLGDDLLEKRARLALAAENPVSRDIWPSLCRRRPPRRCCNGPR